MKPFDVVTGPAVALPLDNIDTDQLIPARFMKRSRTEGYGDCLLYDLRFDASGQTRAMFPLNQVDVSPVMLVAGDNFGCGSSREAAIYALMDHGIRTVIAQSFADIFRNNAENNGLLTIVLAKDDHAALIRHVIANTGANVTVSLEAQLVTVPGWNPFYFEMDPGVKRRLALGLDPLSETSAEHNAISAFETAYFGRYPWVCPSLKR